MVMKSTIRFSLHLTSEQYLRYYRGEARMVQVRAEDGRTVRFPAAALRPFVARDGVRGQFELVLGENDRLLELRRAVYP